MGKVKEQNRARQARHRQRKKDRRERTQSMLGELVKKVKRYPINTDDGEMGYAYKVEGDKDFEDRFAAWAEEHGRTSLEMLDEVMAFYFEELQRLKDEQN